jgi:hypothetical protein
MRNASGSSLQAHGGDVVEIGEADLGHAEAAIDLADHQPVGGQLRQRLAQAADAEAVAFLHLGKAQRAAGRVDARDDVRAQAVIDRGIVFGFAGEGFGDAHASVISGVGWVVLRCKVRRGPGPVRPRRCAAIFASLG